MVVDLDYYSSDIYFCEFTLAKICGTKTHHKHKPTLLSIDTIRFQKHAAQVIQ